MSKYQQNIGCIAAPLCALFMMLIFALISDSPLVPDWPFWIRLTLAILTVFAADWLFARWLQLGRFLVWPMGGIVVASAIVRLCRLEGWNKWWQVTIACSPMMMAVLLLVALEAMRIKSKR